MPSRYAAVTKVARSEWEREAAKLAIQLFQELMAFKQMHRNAIPLNAMILKLHLFLVNKYLANGEFDKVKARLVVDGIDENQEMLPNKWSLAIAIHSVFTVLRLVCQKLWLVVAKIDFKGAFMHTPMTGHQIFMKIDPKITKYAQEMCPELNEFVWMDGCLYTILLKVMYGCEQASAFLCALICR